MPVCEMDVRVGGRYRWRWRSDKDASEFGFAGTFREVSHHRDSCTPRAYDPGTVGDGHPQNEALVTVTFTEESGVTTVTTLIDFGSKEARDAAVATGHDRRHGAELSAARSAAQRESSVATLPIERLTVTGFAVWAGTLLIGIWGPSLRE